MQKRLFFLFFFLSVVLLSRADTFDSMRIALRDRVVLGPTDYDASQPEMRGYLSSLSRQAAERRQKMHRDGSFLWDDVSKLQGNASYTPAHLCESYSRLLTMARAWAYPGTDQYADEALLSEIRLGLALLYRVGYNEKTKMTGNWWEWRIGIPWNYGQIVTILYERLTPEEIDCYRRAVTPFTRPFAAHGDLTYANQASLCRNLMALGILSRDGAVIREALRYVVPAFVDRTSAEKRMSAIQRQDRAIRQQRYPKAAVCKDKEGLYADGSFIQHNAIPYIGTYGIEIIAMAGYMAAVLPGTGFEVPEQIVDVLPTWINRAYLPAMYHGEMMLMLMGRANAGDPYSNARMAALSIMDAATLIPDTAERNAALRAAAGELVRNPHYATPYTSLSPLPLYRPLVDRAQLLAATEADAARSTLWAAGDRLIHQTPAWRMGVSMSSNRIGKYECFLRATGRQNATGWYGGDGMTYLYLPSEPNHYYQYMQHVNPYRLPGTTVSLTPRDEVQSLQPVYGNPPRAVEEARAGGAALDDRYSMAMMQLVGAATDLSAKKTWLMMNDVVVCLGADIRQADSSCVITTIENRRGTHQLEMLSAMPGRWKAVRAPQERHLARAHAIYMNGVGSFMLCDSADLVANTTEEGNTELYINHGAAPDGAGYAYLICPLLDKSGVLSLGLSGRINVVENSAKVQAASDSLSHILSAAFWQRATLRAPGFPIIHSDGAAALIVRSYDSGLSIAVSDPTWDRDRQELIIDGSYRLAAPTPGVTLRVQNNALTYLTIDQRKSLGETKHVRLLKASSAK